MRRFHISTLIALVLIISCARPAAADWHRFFGDESNSNGQTAQETDDGGYVVAGTAWPDDPNTPEIVEEVPYVYLVKTDADGNLEWEQFYGYGLADYGYCVEQTSDGGYVIVGYTVVANGGCQALLFKTDSSGTVEWKKTFGGEYPDSAYEVQETKDGGFIIVGKTNHEGPIYDTLSAEAHFNGNIWLIKTDASGSMEWESSFRRDNYDSCGYSVQQTTDGGYVAVGNSIPFGKYTGDVWLIKTDADGNMEWDNTWKGSASGVRQTLDGGYIVAGYYIALNGKLDSSSALMVKIDGKGSIMWAKRFGEVGTNNWFSDVRQAPDRGYILTGQIQDEEQPGGPGYGIPPQCVGLVKTNAAGDIEWEKSFNEGGESNGSSVRLTSDGGYIIAGQEWIPASPQALKKVYLIKAYAPGESPDLDQIQPLLPKDASANSYPRFYWTPNGGNNNVYAVDFSLSPAFARSFSTYENMGELIYYSNWTMPDEIWNRIPAGATVYWRIRGADLDCRPLTTVTSEKTFSFTKN